MLCVCELRAGLLCVDCGAHDLCCCHQTEGCESVDSKLNVTTGWAARCASRSLTRPYTLQWGAVLLSLRRLPNLSSPRPSRKRSKRILPPRLARSRLPRKTQGKNLPLRHVRLILAFLSATTRPPPPPQIARWVQIRVDIACPIPISGRPIAHTRSPSCRYRRRSVCPSDRSSRSRGTPRRRPVAWPLRSVSATTVAPPLADGSHLGLSHSSGGRSASFRSATSLPSSRELTNFDRRIGQRRPPGARSNPKRWRWSTPTWFGRRRSWGTQSSKSTRLR